MKVSRTGISDCVCMLMQLNTYLTTCANSCATDRRSSLFIRNRVESSRPSQKLVPVEVNSTTLHFSSFLNIDRASINSCITYNINIKNNTFNNLQTKKNIQVRKRSHL